MKSKIFEIADSNMAGDTWLWRYYICNDNGYFTLTGEQEVDGLIDLSIEPVPNLKDGAEIYEALQAATSNYSYDLTEHDLMLVSDALKVFSGKLAGEFSRAEEILEARHEEQSRLEVVARARVLAPYRAIIDAYIARFSDAPLRYPGGGSYGSSRVWAKLFIENYVMEHGHLPSGEHRIIVGGYNGSLHNFSDLRT